MFDFGWHDFNRLGYREHRPAVAFCSLTMPDASGGKWPGEKMIGHAEPFKKTLVHQVHTQVAKREQGVLDAGSKVEHKLLRLQSGRLGWSELEECVPCPKHRQVRF